MKLLVEKIPDLQGLYIRELRLMLSAEETIAVEALVMADSAEDVELIHLLREHILETEVHATRLREILQRATGKADHLKCKVIYSLLDEVEGLIEDAAHPPVRDAALVAEAQRIEHYEIGCYGALRHFARILGRGEDVEPLDMSLREEEETTQRLALIADRIYRAVQQGIPETIGHR